MRSSRPAHWLKWAPLLILLPVLAVLPACTVTVSRPAAPAPAISVKPLTPPPVEAQPNAFFEPAQFDRGLKQARAHPAPAAAGVVLGGLVPHHLLAGQLLSTFFLGLEEQAPATLIVVGPNHPNRGQRIITGRRGWATDFGTVPADQDLIDRLVATGLVTVDDETLAEEHSVGALMPYLRYHAPHTRVVPLILHKDTSIDEVRRLAAELAPLLGPERKLVASVDFSHYLTRAEAEAKDPETLATIRKADLTQLWRMGPDHLDSPPSVGLLLLTMQRLGRKQPEVLANTNSGVLIGNDQIETTSYFVWRYQQQP